MIEIKEYELTKVMIYEVSNDDIYIEYRLEIYKGGHCFKGVVYRRDLYRLKGHDSSFHKCERFVDSDVSLFIQDDNFNHDLINYNDSLECIIDSFNIKLKEIWNL